MSSPLSQAANGKDIADTILGLCEAFIGIAAALRDTLVTKEGQNNEFGDEQLSVDLIAEKIMWDFIEKKKLAFGASEEDPKLVTKSQGRIGVIWDPLDGSSIIDANLSVGSIASIVEAEDGILIGKKGRDIVRASAIAIYGPRLVIVLALPGKGCLELTLIKDRLVITSQEGGLRFSDDAKGRYFAPANLRACQTNVKYNKIIEHYMVQKYTLRYTGGLVPDVYHLMRKGHGIFINPTSRESPAKLRLLYECIPLAHVIELAGGKAVTDEGMCVLDCSVETMQDRCSLICGTEREVDSVSEMLCTSG